MTRRCALVAALTLALLASCTAEAPSGPVVDLLVRIEVGADGARGAQVDAVLPVGAADPRPSATGQLLVHWVDTSNGTVLAHGRRNASFEVMAERFDDDGVTGEPLRFEVFTDQLLLPRPPSGRGRLTVTLGEVARAFEVEVPVDGALPIRFDDSDVVDSATMPLLTGSAIDDRDESDVGGASEALLERGFLTCGDGEVDDRTFFVSPRIGAACEYCDDANNEDGDGCSADCRHEMTHIAGGDGDSDTVTVVFIPMGWGDLGAFLSYVQFAAEGTLAADWFDDNTQKFSFWAMDVEEIDEEGAAGCGADVNALAADVRDAVLASRYDGSTRVAKPLQMVFVPPSDCRSYAWFGGNVMLGVDDRPNVLAHELGHSLGHLNDEYSYAAEGRDCNGPGINVADGEAAWNCIAGETCPDGARVHAYPISPSCPTTTVPCVFCMMSTAAHDFCPVCFRQLDARVDNLLGDTHGESCNGADDDIDGTRDEGCDCSCSPVCDGRDCGPDACFDSCGTCGAGERCAPDGVCGAPCDPACRTALGQDACLGEDGAFACAVSGPDGTVEGLRRCTCLDAGGSRVSPQSCGPCIPFGCEACGADQACRGGACVDACPAPETACDGRCIDTSNDEQNCGGCGLGCGSGEGCIEGACVVPTCSPPLTGCEGVCVDVTSDDENCGACGRTCPSWESCTDGSCNACSGRPDLVVCGSGTCADLQTDPENCGVCGTTCAEIETCRAGSCVPGDGA